MVRKDVTNGIHQEIGVDYDVAVEGGVDVARVVIDPEGQLQESSCQACFQDIRTTRTRCRY
jgi:hypothetical protein